MPPQLQPLGQGEQPQPSDVAARWTYLALALAAAGFHQAAVVVAAAAAWIQAMLRVAVQPRAAGCSWINPRVQM